MVVGLEWLRSPFAWLIPAALSVALAAAFVHWRVARREIVALDVEAANGFQELKAGLCFDGDPGGLREFEETLAEGQRYYEAKVAHAFATARYVSRNLGISLFLVLMLIGVVFMSPTKTGAM